MGVTINNVATWCADKKNTPGMKARMALVAMCGVNEIAQRIAHVDGDPSTDYYIDTDIDLNADYNFRLWEFRYPKEEEPFNFEDTGVQDAPVITIAGQVFLPGIDAFITRNVNALKNGEWAILYWDENNPFPRLVGETGKGVTIKVKQQHNPKNGNILTFSGTLSDLPAFYRGAINYG